MEVVLWLIIIIGTSISLYYNITEQIIPWLKQRQAAKKSINLDKNVVHVQPTDIIIGDMYIDQRVSGNTIWVAESDISAPECKLIAREGTSKWYELMGTLSFDNISKFQRAINANKRLIKFKEEMSKFLDKIEHDR